MKFSLKSQVVSNNYNNTNRIILTEMRLFYYSYMRLRWGDFSSYGFLQYVGKKMMLYLLDVR